MPVLITLTSSNVAHFWTRVGPVDTAPAKLGPLCGSSSFWAGWEARLANGGPAVTTSSDELPAGQRLCVRCANEVRAMNALVEVDEVREAEAFRRRRGGERGAR